MLKMEKEIIQLKMDKSHKKHFTEENIQMINKHIKRCSQSLAIRKLHNPYEHSQ